MNQYVSDAMIIQTARQTVASVVFEFMQAHGMDRIFGNPGSTELPMFVDLPKDISYILGLQESLVVGMADAYSQVTGKAAFVNLHSAAGLGHGMGALYTAFRNRSPLIITTGQQTRDLLPFDPFLFAESPTEFPKPYVKWAYEPASPEAVPLALARAYHMAMQEPRGPVMISIPLSDWSEPAEKLEIREVSTSLGFNAKALEPLSACLENSHSPAIVVGPAVDAANAWDEIISLAEALQAKVWVSPLSPRCSFPERHPLFAGFLAAYQPAISNALSGSDIVLVVGAPVFTYHYAGDKQHLPDGSELWLLSDDTNHIAGAAVGNAVRGDIRQSLEHLAENVSSRSVKTSEPLRQIRRLNATNAITPEFFYQTLSDIRSKDSIIVEEAPSARGALHDHFPIERPRSFFATASGGLGYGLPAAVGAALARPAEPVIAIIGDGSSMYSIQALWSAVEYQTDLFVIILNNGGYGALRGMAMKGQARRIDGVEIGHLDFVKIAEAQGCYAEFCSDGTKLEQSLRGFLAMKGPRLLEIIIREDA